MTCLLGECFCDAVSLPLLPINLISSMGKSTYVLRSIQDKMGLKLILLILAITVTGGSSRQCHGCATFNRVWFSSLFFSSIRRDESSRNTLSIWSIEGHRLCPRILCESSRRGEWKSCRLRQTRFHCHQTGWQEWWSIHDTYKIVHKTKMNKVVDNKFRSLVIWRFYKTSCLLDFGKRPFDAKS